MHGEKEKANALSEGKFPVIDAMTDVFAVMSSAGTYYIVRTVYHPLDLASM